MCRVIVNRKMFAIKVGDYYFGCAFGRRLTQEEIIQAFMRGE